MTHKIKEILIKKGDLEAICRRLGQDITRDFQGKEVCLIGVLKGAFIFMADLVRQIDLPLEIEFMSVSSYGTETLSSGIVQITKDIDTDIRGKHVIIVEDIVDSGLTLKYLRDYLKQRQPESVSLCVAFDKPERRQVEIEVDYVGMKIPDEFVVGYGLDVAGKYRNLPEIAVLEEILEA